MHLEFYAGAHGLTPDHLEHAMAETGKCAEKKTFAFTEAVLKRHVHEVWQADEEAAEVALRRQGGAE